MIKFAFILIIAFVFTENCICQTYSSIISDKEIYDFLNWVSKHEKKHPRESWFKKKKLWYRMIEWDSIDFIDSMKRISPRIYTPGFIFSSENGLDTIFDHNDRLYIISQFSSIKDTVWHNKFNKTRLIYKTSISNANHYYYSIPLFSANKKYVIVKIYYACGVMCGNWDYCVYKNIGNKEWKKLKAGIFLSERKHF